VKAEEIDAAVPGRTEHQGVRPQGVERGGEPARIERGSVRADGHNLQVAQGADVRKRVLHPLAERAPALREDAGIGREPGGAGISHDDQVDARQSPGGRDGAVAQRREQRLRPGEALGASLTVGTAGASAASM
jgi:hypothetical protein